MTGRERRADDHPAPARGGAVLVLLLAAAGCKYTLERTACARDADCPSDQVCAADDLCLPIEVARESGIELGDECGAGRDGGACGAGFYCQQGWCRPDPAFQPDAAELPDAAEPPDAGPTDPCTLAPLFGGVTEVSVETSTEVIVRWFAAADPTTAEDAMLYRIYVATSSLAQSYTAPVAEVTGVLEHRLTGLTAGETIWIAVRSRNLGGYEDCNVTQVSATPGAAPPCVDYAAIQPILRNRCISCHRGPTAPSHLRLDSYEGLLAGGVRRETVVACKPDESHLVTKLSDPPPYGARMPNDGPPFLSDGQVQQLRQWITDGARATCEDPSPCLDVTAPAFAGPSGASAIDPSTIRLSWAAASDDTTPSSYLRYDVYEAAAPGLEATNLPAQHSVVGVTSIDVRVAPETSLCFIVRARDLAGNDDGNTAEVCVTTGASACALEYDADVAPILLARCGHCHATERPARDLSVLSYGKLIAGGVIGPEVVACDAAASPLSVKLADYVCGSRMPFDGPPYLAPSEQAVIDGWITAGARRTCADPSPCGDSTPPAGGEITTASPIDLNRTRVCWTAASDAQTPASGLTFDIYEATSTAAFRFDRPPQHRAPPETSCADLPVPSDTRLCFAVRARDLAGLHGETTTSTCATAPAACVDHRALVQPIFDARCVHCHNTDTSLAGLSLSSHAEQTANVRVVRACQADQSTLIGRIDRCEMPYDTAEGTGCGPACLAPSQRLLLREWIGEGATEICMEGVCP